MKRQRLEESIPEKEKKPDQNQLYTNMRPIGNFKDCDFYVSDAEDRSGITFRFAYKTANQLYSTNNKELCSSWGSMMCVMTAGRLRVPVDLALNRIGVRPREVMLPSEARKFNINVTDVPEMDWPSILVTFGCCILLIFKNKWDSQKNYVYGIDSKEESIYKAEMSNHVSELQKRVGYVPAILDMQVPFDFRRAKTIRSMLGVTSALRESAMKYIIAMANLSSEDSGIGSVCQYLCSVLSESGRMHEFNIMNEMLVKTESAVLDDPRVAEEVANLNEAREAVQSRHPHSKFFMHLATDAELWKLDCSRFPILIAVAQALVDNDQNEEEALAAVGL